MKAIINFFSGRKTYITAILFAVFNLGLALGYWEADNQVIVTINTLLGAFGFSFLRAGITKSGS